MSSPVSRQPKEAKCIKVSLKSSLWLLYQLMPCITILASLKHGVCLPTLPHSPPMKTKVKNVRKKQKDIRDFI